MSARAWIAASVFTAIALAGTAGRTWPAKPPDLPAAPLINCDWPGQNPAAGQGESSDPGADGDVSNPETCGARRLYLKGEFYRRSGYPVSASLYYQQARQLCPHGAYGERAAARLAELGVPDAPEDDAAEDGSSEEEDSVPVPAVEDRVAEILEDCQRALAAGAYAAAENLACQALAIDPDCRPAQALAGTVRRLLRHSATPTAGQTPHAGRLDGSAEHEPPPVLFIDPPETDLSVTGGQTRPAGCCGLARFLEQIIQPVACTEVDDSRPGRLRARCRIWFGTLEVCVEVNSDGDARANFSPIQP